MGYFYGDAEKYWDKLSSKKVRLLQEVPSFKRTRFFSVKQAINDGYNPILFGLRRVGKTTILTQLMNERINDSIYLTFRDS